MVQSHLVQRSLTVAITARVRIMDCYGAQKKDAVSSLGVVNFDHFKPNGISHFYKLDQSISVLRVLGWYFFLFIQFFKLHFQMGL